MNEIQLVNKKLDRIDYEIRTGKRKLLTAKQALQKYANKL